MLTSATRPPDELVDLSASYSCRAQPGAGTALTAELWRDAGARHHAKWSRAGPTAPPEHLFIFSLVRVKSCPPVQAGRTELLWPDPRGALTVIPGKRQIDPWGRWLCRMACDLWLWSKLKCHSGAWVAELMLAEQSAQAVLAQDGRLALKHCVELSSHRKNSETIAGRRGSGCGLKHQEFLLEGKTHAFSDLEAEVKSGRQ